MTKLYKVFVSWSFLLFFILSSPGIKMDVCAIQKLGIDVSEWQGSMDFQKAKQNGVEFAMLRSGYGKNFPNQVDKQFYENVRKAKEAGVPIGAYHYVYATDVENALKEAEMFKKTIGDIKLEYPIAIDVEDQRHKLLSRKEITDIVTTICDSMRRSGFYVSVYFNCDFRKNYLDMNRLRLYEHWFAWYGRNNDGSMPTSSCESDGKMWQYTDRGDGHKYGSSSQYIDLDICYKDYETMIRSNHYNHW